MNCRASDSHVSSFLFILVLATPLTQMFAQWQPTNGPYQGVGSASNLTILDDRIWLTTYPYPYTSTDHGAHWTQPDTPGAYTQYVASGNDLYAGVFSGLWRSTDNGGHWTNFYSATSGYGLNTLMAKDSVIFYTAGGGQGSHLMRLSSNNTVLKDLATPEGVLTHVTVLAQKDSFLFAGSFGGPAVLVSSDNGETWEERTSGLSAEAKMAVFSFAVKDSDIYLGTAEGGVYRSSNNGVHWYSVDNGQIHWGAYVSIMGDILFVSGGQNIFRSTDGGTSWTSASAGLKRESRRPVLVSGTTLYTTTSNGLYFSLDSARIWRRPMNAGTQPAYITRMACGVSCGTAGRRTVFVGGGGFWSSTNGGNDWNEAIPGHFQPGPALIFDSTQWCVASYDEQSLLISVDEGMSWQPFGPQIPATSSYSSLARVDSIYLVVGSLSEYIYRWNMQDTAWQTVPAPGAGYFHSQALLVHNGMVWLRARNGSLFRSTDRGETLQPSGTGVTSQVLSLAACGASLYVGTKGSGVFRSTDNGTTWIKTSTLPTDSNVTALYVDGPLLFAGTSVGGVCYSRDSGLSWHAFGEGLGTDAVNALTSDGENLYAAIAEKGVWVRPLDELTSVTEDVAGTPDAYVLAQNYPNPFNPSTTIRYGLPSRAHVTLTVFNTLGQQVSVLQNGDQDPGYHEVRFDGANLPSGVYFYRMQAGGFVETKRLLLLK